MNRPNSYIYKQLQKAVALSIMLAPCVQSCNVNTERHKMTNNRAEKIVNVIEVKPPIGKVEQLKQGAANFTKSKHEIKALWPFTIKNIALTIFLSLVPSANADCLVICAFSRHSRMGCEPEGMTCEWQRIGRCGFFEQDCCGDDDYIWRCYINNEINKDKIRAIHWNRMVIGNNIIF